jgi:hypothetical protein
VPTKITNGELSCRRFILHWRITNSCVSEFPCLSSC